MRQLHYFYMEVAMAAASLSRCERSKVGCVMVKDDNIISFSYNGTPRGFDNVCEDAKGDTKPEVLHAESNCITKAAKAGYATDGAVLYTTISPCVECAKLIIQCGIKQLFYHEDYRDTAGLNLLIKAHIYAEKI